MEVTSISTVSGWFNDLREIFTYKTRHFENGDTTTQVERRTYHVFLYSATGSLEKDKQLGSNIDVRT